MANRYGLGAVEFEVTVNNDSLVRAFAEGEAKARAGSAKIAAAIKQIQTESDASAQHVISLMRSSNDAFDKIGASAKKAADAQKEFGSGLKEVATSAVGVIAGLAGIKLGLETVNSAAREAVTEMLKVKQIQFELNANLKDGAAQYTQYAEALAKGTKFTTSEVQAAVLAMGVLQNNYKLTSDQVKILTQLSVTLASVTGRDLAESARDIQAAIRGEGEAVEKLRLTLGRDYVKAVGEANSAQRQYFYTLTDAERAQIILGEAQKQGLVFQTAITDRAKSDLGVYDEWNKQVKILSQTFGEDLNKAFQTVGPTMNTFFTDFNKHLQESQAAGVNSIATYLQIAAAIAAIPLTGGASIAFIIDLEKHIREAQKAAEEAKGSIVGAANGLPGFGPNPQEAIDNANKISAAQDAANTRAKKGLNDLIKANEDKATAVTRAIQTEIDDANKQYRIQSELTAKAKHEREQAAEDVKDAGIAAIKEEQEAFKLANQEKLDALREQRDSAKELSTKKKDDTISAIEAEKDAVEQAVEANIHQLEVERDTKLEQLRVTHEAVINAINAEKDVQLDAVDAKIAKAQQEKEALSRVASDIKDAAIRAVEEEQKNRERYFAARIKDADDIKDHAIQRAEEEKDGKLARLTQELRAREDARKQEDRALKDQIDAQKALRDQQDNSADALKESLARRRELQDRALSEDKERISHQRELQNRALADREEAELRSLQHITDATDDAYKTQVDAAQNATDAIIDAIDRQSQAADDAHREALSNIEEEKRARIDEIESRLRAVDELTKSFDNTNKLSDLGLSLTVAQRKGDITESKRIEEEIRREKIRQSYDAAKASLEVQKDATQEELDVRKDALNDEYKARKDAFDLEKKLAKDALDNELDLIKQHNAAIKDSYAQDKQAIQDRYDTLKRALDNQRYAEDQAQAARIKRLDDDRYAEDQQFEANQKLIEAQRAIEDDANDHSKLLIEDRRKQEDRAAEDRKKQIDDVFQHQKDRAQDQYDDTVDKLKKQEQQTKDTFDKRKQIIGDTYDEEKRRVADLYDDPVKGVLAQLRNQRETTSREYKARTDLVNEAYENEKRQIAETYTGEAAGLIPALKRASDAQKIEYDRRKKVAEDAYKAEQLAISDLYDNHQTGLIAQQEHAATAAGIEYGKRSAAVQAAYEAEKKAIYAVYDDPTTGLIKKQADAHQDLITNLEKQKQAWNNWAHDTNEAIQKVLSGPLSELANKLDDLVKKGFIVPAGGGGGGGSGAGNAHGSDGTGGSGVSGTPYDVLFPFDAPYNGPYGGAAWPGGPTRHRGIDLTLPGPNHGRGSPVGAFREGVVETLTNEPAGGQGVITQGPDGLYEYYGHFDSVNVKRGQHIQRGDVVGALGASGLEQWQTPHVHYEVRRNPNGDPVGQTINPAGYMQGLVNTSTNGGANPQLDGETIELRPFGPYGAVVRIKVSGSGSNSDWFQRAYQIAREERFSNPDLFARQMRLESDNFAPDVISGKRHSSAGAIGIAQFVPTTAQMLGVNPLNPVDSLHGASRYMHDLENKYNGVRNALWAYNAGEGNFRAGFLPAETVKYLQMLEPYRNGHLVTEPTLMLGMRTGEMGIAGETGQPERLLGTSATASYDSRGGLQSVSIPVILGNDVIENIIVTGHNLVAKSARGVNLPGFAQA